MLSYSYVPDVFEKRVPLRPAHLALASQYKASGKMLQGGAFTEPPMGGLLTFCQRHTLTAQAKQTTAGRLIFARPSLPLPAAVLDSSRSDVENFVKQDPYVTAGADKKIVTEWSIREWAVAVGSAANPNYVAEPIKAGQAFPKAQTLFEGNPGGAVDVDKLLAGKKVVSGAGSKRVSQ